KYSGSTDAAVALGFADSVFATMASGATRTTSDGQTIVLAATAVTPDRATATSLGLRPSRESAADCPPGLDCRFVPAAYQQNSSGYEHEGFAIQGTTWYTDKMYQASAALTRYLAARYHIALDRAHIIGHDDVPGPTTGFVAGMHWDPGPFWDWARYMELLGAPIRSTARGGNIVTIAPNFQRNQPQVRDCQGNGSLQPPQPENFVYLRTAPSFGAPLFNDPGLATGGTDCANDWGDKAVSGQDFYRVDRQGDWDAIWYAGSKVWFYDPGGRDVVGTAGT